MLVISMIAVTGSKHEIINESVVGVSTTFNETICGTRKYPISSPCIDNRQPCGGAALDSSCIYNTRDR